MVQGIASSVIEAIIVIGKNCSVVRVYKCVGVALLGAPQVKVEMGIVKEGKRWRSVYKKGRGANKIVESEKVEV